MQSDVSPRLPRFLNKLHITQTEKLQINRDVLIMARCVPGCEQEQDLLWDPDIVTGVENQYSAGISLSRHQPFSRVQG